MEESTTVVGVNVTTGKDPESVVVHFNADQEKMIILIEGHQDAEGTQYVNVTASGPEASIEGLRELGEVLASLGAAIASPEMAAQAGKPGDSGATGEGTESGE